MKYCVSSRQPISVLRNADEIKVGYRDRQKMLDFVEDLPDKTYILEIPKGTENIDWEFLKMLAEKVDFILCVFDLSYGKDATKHGIKFYWGYPILSFYELRGLVPFGPCYLLLGAPLYFDLTKVHRASGGIPVRLCANAAYDTYIPRENGVCGTWIRPEDVEVYEIWVSALEFITETLKQEATLLHVYKDNGNWPGNLNLLLTNFGVNVDNRIIPEEIGSTRANCGQRCMVNGSCHFCDVAMRFADTVRKEYYRRRKEEASAEQQEN